MLASKEATKKLAAALESYRKSVKVAEEASRLRMAGAEREKDKLRRQLGEKDEQLQKLQQELQEAREGLTF